MRYILSGLKTRLAKILKKNENGVQNYFNFLGHTIWMSGIAFFVLFAARLAFYLQYGNAFLDAHNMAKVLRAFALGFRFDLLVVSYTNLLVLSVFSLFLLFKRKGDWRRFLPVLNHIYLLVLSFLILLSAMEFYYYAYFLSRFDDIVFAMVEDDTGAILVTMWDDYPVLIIIFAAGVGYYLTYRIAGYFAGLPYYHFYQKWVKIKKPLYHFGVFFFTILFAWSAGAYGSFGASPFKMGQSSKMNREFLKLVTMNSAVSLYKAVQKRREKIHHEFNFAKEFGYENINRAVTDYYGFSRETSGSVFEKVQAVTSPVPRGRPHVILVVMESFGSYYLKFHGPHFNLMGELEYQLPNAVSFSNFVSATEVTLGSIISLVTTLPPMDAKRFLSAGRYKDVKVSCAAARPYQNAGYETSFIYAGDPDWRNMKPYYLKQGLDHMYSLDDIEKYVLRNNPEKIEDMKGTWGAFDEYLFDFTLDKLKQAKKPQLIIVLSTTNHPPFEIPKSYRPFELQAPERIRKHGYAMANSGLERFRAYQYSNHSLGIFIKKIRQSALMQNTIVAATGDHTFRSLIPDQNDLLAQYGVPFFLFLPESLKPNHYNANVLGSHGDIWPTLYNLSLRSAHYCDLGKDLFNTKEESLAVYNSWIFSSQGAIHYLPDDITYYSWKAPGFSSIQEASYPEEMDETVRRYRALMVLSEALLLEDLEKQRR